ncbi:MAG: hypothetical protein ACO20X_15415, partial [Alphaproteobacteria bacterium]
MEFRYLIFTAAISVLLFSSIFDFKYLKIPNWNIILLFILGIIYQFSLDKELIDIFVYLQPTSPLRVVQDIDTSIFEMVHGDFKSAVSICKTGENPFCVFVKNNETMTPLFENYFGMNRQELPMT